VRFHKFNIFEIYFEFLMSCNSCQHTCVYTHGNSLGKRLSLSTTDVITIWPIWGPHKDLDEDMYSLEYDAEIPTFRGNLQRSSSSFLTLETSRTNSRNETESYLRSYSSTSLQHIKIIFSFFSSWKSLKYKKVNWRCLQRDGMWG